MAAEIAPAGRIPGRNDRQGIGQIRQFERTLPVQQSLLLQPRDRLPPDALLFAERHLRLQVVDRQGQAVELAVTHLHARQDGHPDLQVRARRIPEIPGQHPVARTPDDSLRLGHRPAVLGLAQIQVAMPACLDADTADLRPHPDFVREQVLYPHA